MSLSKLYVHADYKIPRWSILRRSIREPATYIDYQCVYVRPFTIDLIMEKELVLSLPVVVKGKDRWGYYYNFTGHEQPGYCFWCGAEVGRRYCFGKGHRARYWEQYVWSSASYRCRQNHKIAKMVYFCDDCGHEGRRDDFQVHHIQPMMGHGRSWHYLNMQDNLTHLCHDCHNRRHRELNAAWEGIDIPTLQVDEGQMEFVFAG